MLSLTICDAPDLFSDTFKTNLLPKFNQTLEPNQSRRVPYLERAHLPEIA
jgi:hypothetical protein